MFNTITKVFLFFLSISTFSSCSFSSSDNSADIDTSCTTTVVQRIDVHLPKWVIDIPSGNKNIIGISRVARDFDQTFHAAKEMATIQYARNLSSYNIRNYIQAEKTYTDSEYHDYRSFVFQVSDAAKLHRIYDHLHLKEYYQLHNSYFIALFEFDDSQSREQAMIDLDRDLDGLVSVSRHEIPQWYQRDAVKRSGEFLESTAKASSSSLIEAWSQAAQQARLLQSVHYSTMVSSLSETGYINDLEKTRSAVAVETLYNLRDIEFSKSHIQSLYRDNNLTYTVYIKLRIRNYLTDNS